jgi:hypothetical protein
MRVKPGRGRLTMVETKTEPWPKQQFTRPGQLVWYIPVGSQQKDRWLLFVARLLDSPLGSVRATGLFRAPLIALGVHAVHQTRHGRF